MKHILFKGIRKIVRDTNPYTDEYAQYKGQAANNLILKRITDDTSGIMISKFGTVELDNILCYTVNERGIKFIDLIRAFRGEYSIYSDESISKLCNNAGFFPCDVNLLEQYYKLVKDDVGQIDILGSYIKSEKYIDEWLPNNNIKVDLEGYYAPFMWENPWTKALKGKKVLVVHPFVKSIEKQYSKRELLFDNPEVLPEFEDLKLIKAIQSIAGNGEKTGFHNWFEALDYMKSEIDKIDYEYALIGCGAYGMDLAAHVKRRGKKAIHLAGWTQMLFGIYGERWITDQPQYSKYINKHWIRPMKEERPIGAEKVEKGCYW